MCVFSVGLVWVYVFTLILVLALFERLVLVWFQFMCSFGFGLVLVWFLLLF